MITGIGVGLVSGMVPTEINLGGKKFSAQDFISKELNQYLGKFTEPILMLSIGDLAAALEASRKKAEAEKAQTMEVYLGRLPWLTALMFRNTFFPIWNLLAEKVFGSVLGPMKSVLGDANSKLNTVRDRVDQAKNAEDTAEKYADAAKDVHADAAHADQAKKPFDDAQAAADADAAKRKADRDAEAAKKKSIDDFVDDDQLKKKDAKFPVTGRVADGQGLKVEEELPSVIPEGAATSASASSTSPPASGAPVSPSVPGL